jgi:hypothetical protein
MGCLGLISEVRPGAFFAQPAKAPSATRATLEEAKAYVESTLTKTRAPRAAVTSAPDLFST